MNLAIITFTVAFVSSKGINACLGFDRVPSTIGKTNDAINELSGIKNIEDDNDRIKRSVVVLLPVSESAEENQDSGNIPSENELGKMKSRSRQERCKSPSTLGKQKRTILASAAETTDENSDKNQYFRLASVKNAQNLLKSVLTSRMARGDNKASRDEVILKPREQDSVLLIAKDPKKSIDEAPKKYVCYCVEESSEPTVSMKNPVSLHGIKRKIRPDVLGKSKTRPVAGHQEKPSDLLGSERIQDRRECPGCAHRPILPKAPATSGKLERKPITPQRLQLRPLKLKTPPTIQPCPSDTEQVGQPTKFNIPLNNDQKVGSPIPRTEKKLPQGSQIMQPALKQNEPRVSSLPPALQASLSALQSAHGYLPNERTNYDPYTSVPIGPNIFYPAPYMILPQYQQFAPYPLQNDGLVSASQTGDQVSIGKGEPSCDENIAMPHKDTHVDMDECIRVHGRDYCMVTSTSQADVQENGDNSNVEQGEPVIGAVRDEEDNYTTAELSNENNWQSTTNAYNPNGKTTQYYQVLGVTADDNEDEETLQQSEEYSESQPNQYSSDMELPTTSDGVVDSEQRMVKVNNSNDYKDDVESSTVLGDAQSLLTADPDEREDYSDTVNDFESGESPVKATEYSQFSTPGVAGNVQAAHGISSNDYLEMTIEPSEANTVSSANEDVAARNDHYVSTDSPELGTTTEFANEQGINLYTTMESNRYETTPILEAREPENSESSSPITIAETRTSSPRVQNAEGLGDIQQTTPFDPHNVIQSTTEHTNDVKYDEQTNSYSQFVGSYQSTTETIDPAMYRSDNTGEPFRSSTDRHTTSYNLLPEESSSTTMISYELGLPSQESSRIYSFSTTERSGDSSQHSLQETSENERSLGSALTTLRNVYTTDDDSIDHTSMRSILEESMGTEETFTIDGTQQTSHHLPEYGEELSEPVGIGNPTNNYSDRPDDEPHSSQSTTSTPLYNNPSTYSTALRSENRGESTDSTLDSDTLGNTSPMPNPVDRNDSLILGSIDENSTIPDDELSESEPSLSSSMMVDEHRYENGQWHVAPVDLAGNDEIIEAQQEESTSNCDEDIIGRPQIDLHRARLPSVEKNIAETIMATLKNAEQNEIDPSAILDALKHVINRVETSQTYSPVTSPMSGKIGKVPTMPTNNQDVKNLPVIPVTEHFFKDGSWSERQAVVGNQRKYSNPDMADVTMASTDDPIASLTSRSQASTVDANEYAAATGPTDYAFLGDSRENEDEELTTHYHSIEDVVGITEGTFVQTTIKAPEISGDETEVEDIQTVATKYYSPNSRMMAYIKNIRDPEKARKLQDGRKLGAPSPRTRVTTEVPSVGLELSDFSPTTETSLELTRTTQQQTFGVSEENVGRGLSTDYHSTESIVSMSDSIPISTTRRISVMSRNEVNEEGFETISMNDGLGVTTENVSPSIQLESRRTLQTTDAPVELVVSSEQSMAAIAPNSRRDSTEKPMPYTCPKATTNDVENVGSRLSTNEGNNYSETSSIPQSSTVQSGGDNTYTTATNYVGAEYSATTVESNDNADEEIVTMPEISSTIFPLTENVRSRDYSTVQYSDEEKLTMTDNPEGIPISTGNPEGIPASTGNPEGNLEMTESFETSVALTENPQNNLASTVNAEESLGLTENPNGISASTGNPERNLEVTENSEGDIALTENSPNNLASTVNAEESLGLTENPKGISASTGNPEGNLEVTENSERNVALTENSQNNLASTENPEESQDLTESPEENVDTFTNTQTSTSQSLITNTDGNGDVGNSPATVNYEENLKVEDPNIPMEFSTTQPQNGNEDNRYTTAEYIGSENQETTPRITESSTLQSPRDPSLEAHEFLESQFSSTDNIVEDGRYSTTEQFQTNFENGIGNSPGVSDVNGQILASENYENVDQGVTVPGYVENTLNDRNQLGAINENGVESTSEINFKNMQSPEPDYAIPEVTEINSAQAANSRDDDDTLEDFPIEEVGTPREEHVDSDKVALSSPGQSSTLDYDPTYLGKITLGSLNPDGNKISDLQNTDLFYVGDGVKIPLKMSRMNDGSWSLSISDKICESFIKKKCACCVSNEGDIVEERKRRNTVEHEMSSENSDSFEPPNNSELLGEPKNRHARSSDDDLVVKIATPVEKFAEKYDLTFDAIDCPVDSVKSWRRMKTKSRKDVWNERRRNRANSRNVRILKLFENNNRVHRDNSEESEDREIDDDKRTRFFKKYNVIKNAQLTFDTNSDELMENLLNADEVPESLKTEIVVNALDDLINTASAYNLNPMIESYRMIKRGEENSMQDQWGESDDYNLNEMENEMAKYGYQRDNPIWERIRFVKKKQNERGPYRYQRNIDHRVMGRMNVWKTVLQWLKRVFLESRAYDEA